MQREVQPAYLGTSGRNCAAIVIGWRRLPRGRNLARRRGDRRRPAVVGLASAEALAYMRERALAAHVIALLAEHPDRCFADQQAWHAHLDKLGITELKVSPAPGADCNRGGAVG
jgi:hypothetical protein